MSLYLENCQRHTNALMGVLCFASLLLQRLAGTREVKHKMSKMQILKLILYSHDACPSEYYIASLLI